MTHYIHLTIINCQGKGIVFGQFYKRAEVSSKYIFSFENGTLEFLSVPGGKSLGYLCDIKMDRL